MNEESSNNVHGMCMCCAPAVESTRHTLDFLSCPVPDTHRTPPAAAPRQMPETQHQQRTQASRPLNRPPWHTLYTLTHNSTLSHRRMPSLRTPYGRIDKCPPTHSAPHEVRSQALAQPRPRLHSPPDPCPTPPHQPVPAAKLTAPSCRRARARPPTPPARAVHSRAR